MTELEQLRNDILYTAKRLAIIESAVIRMEDALLNFNKANSEWGEFMTSELLKQGIRINKNKTSFEYFRSSLKETHKEHYEKFESLFGKVRKLYEKEKPKGKYD